MIAVKRQLPMAKRIRIRRHAYGPAQIRDIDRRLHVACMRMRTCTYRFPELGLMHMRFEFQVGAPESVYDVDMYMSTCARQRKLTTRGREFEMYMLCQPVYTEMPAYRSGCYVLRRHGIRPKESQK
jgi:hypothetical protein